MANEYKVQLDNYDGPLDLLLYLIRRQEVDIQDIPIASITAQYLATVEVLQQLDPDHTADFLVLAATLMEIKSRTLLPKPPPPEEDEPLGDPRLELVHQLLEYKKFKDAALRLGAQARQQALRFGRLPVLLPAPRQPEVDLEQLQIWDLVFAFGKLLRQIGLAGAGHEIVYDDTPVALHAADLSDRLSREGGSLPFEDAFRGRSKGEIIGLFLALLELVRQRRVRAEQERPFGRIILHLLDAAPLAEAEIHPPAAAAPGPPPAGAEDPAPRG